MPSNETIAMIRHLKCPLPLEGILLCRYKFLATNWECRTLSGPWWQGYRQRLRTGTTTINGCSPPKKKMLWGINYTLVWKLWQIWSSLLGLSNAYYVLKWMNFWYRGQGGWGLGISNQINWVAKNVIMIYSKLIKGDHFPALSIVWRTVHNWLRGLLED